MRKQIWLGFRKVWVNLNQAEIKSEIVRTDATPTLESHGDVYIHFIGPFRTLRGAKFMRDFGTGNPHCRNVRDAERLGKKYESNGIGNHRGRGTGVNDAAEVGSGTRS